MSFRNRLTLFFVLIVLVPMVSVAILLLRLISDVQDAKTIGAVRAQREMVVNLYAQAIEDARNAFDRVALDPQLVEALRQGDCQAARDRLRGLIDRERIARIRLVEDGDEVCVAGHSDAIAPAEFELESPQGQTLGALQISVTRAPGFTRRVRRLVGTGLAVCAGSRLLATSVDEVGDCPLTDQDTAEGPQGEDLQVSCVPVRRSAPVGFAGRRPTLCVLFGQEQGNQISGDVTGLRLLAGGIMLGFFVLALAFALAVSRQLHQQVAGLLEAVRRLGRGDFSTRAPTEGRDEFSALGEEFNKMADQLAARVGELGRERERVLTAVRSLGEAMGSSLDRERLLEIVVTTAVEGVGAHGGRVTLRRTGDAPMEVAARAGGLRGLDPILREVEDRVLRSGASAEVAGEGAGALAHPLMTGEGEQRRVHGVISVARAGAAFTDPDRELFRYLAGQAAVAIENVNLHETVAHESVTDELTGLSNRRRFDEALSTEVEAWRRGGERVGLVMLDIDDFKPINDTRGHPQGDEVLREVARVLRENVREIDEPARYGGEEFVLVLRVTDLDGAYNLAEERLRHEIERLQTDVGDGGPPVRITASFGVASLPECARDEESLVAAADAALLEAKRLGKNRVVRAPRII